MDEISDDDLRKAIEVACLAAQESNFQNIVTVADEVRRQAKGPNDSLWMLADALYYNLVVDVDQRRGYGPFGPIGEIGETGYPARLESIDSDVLVLWNRSLDCAPIPIVRARLADLLWERRHGDRPHEYAHRAIDEYVRSSGDNYGEPIERVDGLLRALELAKSINDVARHEQVVQAIVEFASRELDGEERRPGVALGLLDALVNLSNDRRPTGLVEMIDRAIKCYGDDPWNLEAALEIRAQLTEQADRKSLRRIAVEAFADMARKSTGVVKYAHFQHAIEHAERHGLHQLAEELRREVEELPKDSLDLQIVSGEIQIPREEIDKLIAKIVGDDNVEAALVRFGLSIATSDPEDIREFVKQSMAEHPIQFIIPRMVIGPENSLVRLIDGAAEQEEMALVEYESLQVSLFSTFAVQILEAIRIRYGPISNASTWFNSDLIESEVAERIGKAIEYFESGDPDSCASVITPRLERIIRRAASVAGHTVTRSPDRSGRSGGVKGLGELLSLLDGSISESTRRYIRVVMSEVTGLNLRNRVSHGLVDSVTSREAALLIHIACHLRMYQRRSPDGDTPTD